MAKIFTPLAPNVPIVDEKGNPTPYFQRVMQELSDAKISASLADALGGDPGEDAVVTWNDTSNALEFVPNDELLELNDLTDVDTTGVGTGDVLTFDGADWVPDTPTSGGSGAWQLIEPNGSVVAEKAFTITIASPGVVTSTGHGYVNDTPVLLTTTGALPTGLTVGTTYYVRNSAANTFELSATAGGASINTTGTQSGTHTVKKTFSWVWSTNVTGVDFTNLENYDELLILSRLMTKSVSGVVGLAVSVNNGSSFYNGASDYIFMNNAGVEAVTSLGFGFHSTSTALARSGWGFVRNMKSYGPKSLYSLAETGASPRYFMTSMLPINAIRILNSSGGNLTGGSLAVYAQ